jgi:hypothetical protein
VRLLFPLAVLVRCNGVVVVDTWRNLAFGGRRWGGKRKKGMSGKERKKGRMLIF